MLLQLWDPTRQGCITFIFFKVSKYIASFLMSSVPRNFEKNMSNLLQSYIILFLLLQLWDPTRQGCITFTFFKVSKYIASFLMSSVPRNFEKNMSNLLQSYIILFLLLQLWDPTRQGCITFIFFKVSMYIASLLMSSVHRNFEKNMSNLLQSYIILFGGILIRS